MEHKGAGEIITTFQVTADSKGQNQGNVGSSKQMDTSAAFYELSRLGTDTKNIPHLSGKLNHWSSFKRTIETLMEAHDLLLDRTTSNCKGQK